MGCPDLSDVVYLSMEIFVQWKSLKQAGPFNNVNSCETQRVSSDKMCKFVYKFWYSPLKM